MADNINFDNTVWECSLLRETKELMKDEDINNVHVSESAVAWAGKMLAKIEVLLLERQAAATSGKTRQRNHIASVITCIKGVSLKVYPLKELKIQRSQGVKDSRSRRVKGCNVSVTGLSPKSSQPEFVQ